MKAKDFYFIIVAATVFSPFFWSEAVLETYKTVNHAHPMIMSFFKFAVLATIGEVIGLRIKTGNYNQPGFGIVPRALVWGFIGLTIKLAFMIFYTGTPFFLEKTMGIAGARKYLEGPLGINKVAVAFAISVAMNVIYAPVMMTFHKITDTHIDNNSGTIRGLFRPIPLGKIFRELNWDVQYNFVFKKTIPLFWIPAHTITFLLPVDWQVLFAALLGIMLGVFLAVASQLGKKEIITSR